MIEDEIFHVEIVIENTVVLEELLSDSSFNQVENANIFVDRVSVEKMGRVYLLEVGHFDLVRR